MLYRVVDWAKYISTYLYIGIIVFNNNTNRKKVLFTARKYKDSLFQSVYKQQQFFLLLFAFFASRGIAWSRRMFHDFL